MDNNFFKWMTQPISIDEIEIWMNVNNMIREKIELFSDFSFSLYNLINDTYLGDDNTKETNIVLSDDEKKMHFDWCWNKTIDNFTKENLFFNRTGDHYDYFSGFFKDAFYFQKDDKVRKSIDSFFKELYYNFEGYTKSDLDMITEIYKMLDKNLSFKNLY